MSTNQPAVSSPSGPMPTVTAPPTSSAGRLIVLLGLLGLVTAALIYDYAVAGPGVDAAEKKLDAFADARNRLSVTESGPITPEDVHKELGMTPTFVEKHPDKYYMVEYYCWWGRVPVMDVHGNRRHFIAVVYVGDKTMRFNSYHKNEVPTNEALPFRDEEQPPATTDEAPLPKPESPKDPSASSPPADAPSK